MPQIDTVQKIEPELEESCWDALLKLSASVREYPGKINICSISFGRDSFVGINQVVPVEGNNYLVILRLPEGSRVLKKANTPRVALFEIEESIRVVQIDSSNLPAEIQQFLEVYLPYCFASYFARAKRRSFSVAHLAISLDGCLASKTGDSKWIGSEENLSHAHRMRALCDAVLIGSRTLNRDQSRLTVRHVNGPDPTRVILGRTVNQVDSLVRSSPKEVLLIGGRDDFGFKNVKKVDLNRVDGLINGREILEYLFQHKIYSVYIEGGEMTASRFLLDQALDMLQLHISPILLGDGLKAFNVHLTENVANSIRFKWKKYVNMKDDPMFVGRLTD